MRAPRFPGIVCTVVLTGALASAGCGSTQAGSTGDTSTAATNPSPGDAPR